MNFHLLRYSLVLVAAYVGIFALLMVEALVVSLIADADYPIGHTGIFRFTNLVAHLIYSLIEQNERYLFVIFLGAYALAAYTEGRRYLNRNSKRPKPLNLLSGSVAMAITGLALVLAVGLTVAFQLDPSLSFSDLNIASWNWLNISTAVLAVIIVCRISFGFGLREARWQHSIQTGSTA